MCHSSFLQVKKWWVLHHGPSIPDESTSTEIIDALIRNEGGDVVGLSQGRMGLERGCYVSCGIVVVDGL